MASEERVQNPTLVLPRGIRQLEDVITQLQLDTPPFATGQPTGNNTHDRADRLTTGGHDERADQRRVDTLGPLGRWPNHRLAHIVYVKLEQLATELQRALLYVCRIRTWIELQSDTQLQ
jgi:hypothetical protein